MSLYQPSGEVSPIPKIMPPPKVFKRVSPYKNQKAFVLPSVYPAFMHIQDKKQGNSSLLSQSIEKYNLKENMTPILNFSPINSKESRNIADNALLPPKSYSPRL
jgi:hypothetical protein